MCINKILKLRIWHTEDIQTDTNEIKYLVYESHLLSLFTQCRSCHQHCTGKIAHQMGSFICVKQECCHCDHTYTWKSQPFVKDTPAANLLMSAAIMFSGSTPGKVLLVLKHLNMASIKERAFFDQKKYCIAENFDRGKF